MSKSIAVILRINWKIYTAGDEKKLSTVKHAAQLKEYI